MVQLQVVLIVTVTAPKQCTVIVIYYCIIEQIVCLELLAGAVLRVLTPVDDVNFNRAGNDQFQLTGIEL